MARIGVLAVQGGFAAHASVLAELGHVPVEIRSAADLRGLEGVVFPGGESTAMLRAIECAGLETPLLDVARRVPVLATCAGLILLARQVSSPAQRSFSLIDVSVERNGWGRQLDSFEAVSDGGRPLVFIRAPRISGTGPEVEILERFRGEPVMVRHGSVIAATCHPELTGPAVHREVFGGSLPAPDLRTGA